ncbi:MAG: hypothetical protein IJY25_00625 [Bacilli bacterium]|nr:hypothetical protein [Bacilli bacterium]
MNFIKSIRENLKDPKKKALTQLGIYLVFFIFVFAVLSGSNPPTENYIEEEIPVGINSYEYIYKINNNGVLLEVNGTLTDTEEIFNYNGLQYSKIGNVVYLNNEIVTEIFNTDLYKYNNIETLIEKSEFIEKTTYKDNNEKTTYNISMDKYFSVINEINNCTNIDCTVINSNIVVESSDNINKVTIDLTNYYGYLYTIEINYNNINNIEKISTN